MCVGVCICNLVYVYGFLSFGGIQQLRKLSFGIAYSANLNSKSKVSDPKKAHLTRIADIL